MKDYKGNLTHYLNINKKISIVDIHKKKGIRPNYDIYIGRRVNGTEFNKDSKWAKRHGESLPEYEKRARKTLWNDLDELKGKTLGGWCLNTDKITPLRCHAQILLKLFNEKFN
jgi:hypothetical protein